MTRDEWLKKWEHISVEINRKMNSKFGFGAPERDCGYKGNLNGAYVQYVGDKQYYYIVHFNHVWAAELIEVDGKAKIVANKHIDKNHTLKILRVIRTQMDVLYKKIA
ncbi:hypothetical protein B1O87_002961 [Escherichia coli]|uniref:hypothetical protein n=1 Tax=Escherichia coli TaxID=562 RepID=UPI0010CB2574|nr:hypothetical protein [Escherichia coli]EFA1899443.1 hypothetical protein [Escherichia coli]EFF6379706.1 hypothetical protein [Escherichia coli]EKT1593196.1 hypothetical protein [Escherichia coli]GDN91595.1 hypothetical protein BvCmsNSP001_00495 [Escherichia coli]